MSVEVSARAPIGAAMTSARLANHGLCMKVSIQCRTRPKPPSRTARELGGPIKRSDWNEGRRPTLVDLSGRGQPDAGRGTDGQLMSSSRKHRKRRRARHASPADCRRSQAQVAVSAVWPRLKVGVMLPGLQGDMRILVPGRGRLSQRQQHQRPRQPQRVGSNQGPKALKVHIWRRMLVQLRFEPHRAARSITGLPIRRLGRRPDCEGYRARAEGRAAKGARGGSTRVRRHSLRPSAFPRQALGISC